MNYRIPPFYFFLIGAALLLSGIGLWFTAIASAAPIPFSSEPEHMRAYLSVEQTQYRDSLFVDYDTLPGSLPCQ